MGYSQPPPSGLICLNHAADRNRLLAPPKKSQALGTTRVRLASQSKSSGLMGPLYTWTRPAERGGISGGGSYLEDVLTRRMVMVPQKSRARICTGI
jgi:hypothetical protein